MISTFEEAFYINPKVTIKKGQSVPFVAMDDVSPWQRDVRATEMRRFSGGARFKDSDVLLARITPSLENGKTSIYRASPKYRSTPAAGSTEFIVIRGKAGKSTSEIGYYLTRTDRLREFAIKTMTGSSGRQRVQVDALSRYQFELPALATQVAIVETLGALDDKIASNSHIISNIPHLISSLFQRACNESATIAVPIDSLAEFINGGAYTKNASGHGKMVVRIADLNSGPGSTTVYNDIEVPDKHLARAGDILMSWSGSLGLYVWDRSDAIINQHIFKVVPKGYPDWLVYNQLSVAIDTFRHIAASKATTMGHIKRNDLSSTYTRIPADNLNELNEVCSSLWNRRNGLMQESLRIVELRDALLPELLSGRIPVSDVKDTVEDAMDAELAEVKRD